MARSFHAVANRLAALFMRLLFGSVARIHVLRPENANRGGGLLLAANHISHFDPLIISAVVRRKIDWMAMTEFFAIPGGGMLLRAVDAFPADRDRANRATIRAAIERLRDGRIVGIFPEGGIRDGKNSILEGAPARSGVAVLADIADVAVLPCVILGSDRLYNKKRWLPSFRRTPIWIGFGDPIAKPRDLAKPALRERLEQDFVDAISKLYLELRRAFSLTADDLPHPPRSRMLD
jgi:1-acyl-sn-glycerol-3-phosphate acyltransferase